MRGLNLYFMGSKSPSNSTQKLILAHSQAEAAQEYFWFCDRKHTSIELVEKNISNEKMSNLKLFNGRSGKCSPIDEEQFVLDFGNKYLP